MKMNTLEPRIARKCDLSKTDIKNIDLGEKISILQIVFLPIGIFIFGLALPPVLLLEPPLIIYIMYYLIRRRYRYSRGIRELLKSKQAQFDNDVEYQTRNMNQLLSNSKRLYSAIIECYVALEKELDRANQHYKDHSLGYFWDSIEKIYCLLRSVSSKLSTICSETTQYYSIKKSHANTFPEYPVVVASLPDTSKFYDELNVLIYEVQRNYEFQSIWEMRKIQSLLSQGFSSVADAISDAQRSLSSEMASMRSSIASNIQELSSSERRSMDKMMSDIKDHDRYKYFVYDDMREDRFINKLQNAR